MSRITTTDPARRRLLRLLGGLLGSMSLAGAAGAQQPQAEALASSGHASATPTNYRVINLGAEGFTSVPQINDRGQVAYTIGDQAFFYDGTRIVGIGPVLVGLGFNTLGLNNAGQVTGTLSTNAGASSRGFVWTRRTGIIELATLGGDNGYGAAINDRGQVAGGSDTPDGTAHAFRWNPGGGLEDISVFPGAGASGFTSSTAIGGSGLVTGWGLAAGGDPHAFAWTRKTRLIDLGTLGGTSSYAVAVNDKDQVAGYAMVPGDAWHAFIWSPGSGMKDLGVGGGRESFASAINNSGQVVGVINGWADQRGFSWTRADGLVRFGTLGGPSSSASDVNDKGQVVGGATVGSGALRAVIWSAREGLVDLNTRLRHAPAGLVVDFAFAISDNGTIAATSNAGPVLLKPDCGCAGTHAVGPIASVDMAEVGAPVDATVSFAGADTAARHYVTWSWGDGSGDQPGQARESGGSGSARASHVYTVPGIHTIGATVTDLGGQRVTVTRRIVVYGKAEGVVRGSGRFLSPQGTARRAGGTASFDFVAPMTTGAKAAAAKAALQFRTGTLDFRSQAIKPVAVQGQRSQFEGSGTVNGTGDYRFTVSTTSGEGGSGRFGLKIWHVDPVTRAEVVDYDNRSAGPGNAGPAVQGSIVHQQ